MARKKKKITNKHIPIEQYEHKDKKRLNNPPVGLVDARTDNGGLKKKTYQYDPHLDPQLQWNNKRAAIEKIIDNGIAAGNLEEAVAAFKELKQYQEPYLNWAGKAEHTSFDVPTVSLHVHERIDPRRIIEAVRKEKAAEGQPSLFEADKKPLREAIEFYKHKENWSNRLVAGDSLLIMNSLLEKEGMGGKVQMVYFDPPYGIKYGSNFQPFVNKRDVKDGKDEDLTAEPEMIKAFRDTWELGIHSFLSYIRDRFILSKELLRDNGCIFLQISDENLHLMRNLLDEVFGKENFVSQITFQKIYYRGSLSVDNVADYLLVFAKNKERFEKEKFRPLFRELSEIELLEKYNCVEDANGELRQIKSIKEFDKDKCFFHDNLLSPGASNEIVEIEFNEKIYRPDNNYHWKTGYDGLLNLRKKGRFIQVGNWLKYKRYATDFPYGNYNNIWTDTVPSTFAEKKIYAVQTYSKVIQRCLLITTDPGDLVLDITCGSGTTAFVAENWGRRWITCDTSRVAIALAKQRIMTGNFDYYELAHPHEGVGSGFKYKTVPHITLKSIANNEPPGQETLYDQPYIDSKRLRVTGPFTVEAVPAPVARSFEEVEQPPAPSQEGSLTADTSIARSGETLRQSNWRDELLRAGVRAKGGKVIEFTRVEPLSGTRYLQAEAETKPFDSAQGNNSPKRVLVCFGPEHAPLEQRMVELALEEAEHLKPKAQIVLFCAFQFDEEAAKDIDETNWPGVTLLKAQMNADLLTDDLKKKRSSNESFWLIGQPDVILKKSPQTPFVKGGDKRSESGDLYQVEVQGFDYYNPKTGTVESGGKGDIAMWMLDSDYDGRSLFPSQVFFPMAGAKEGWATLAKNLKAEIDEEKIVAFGGTVSLPFTPGKAVAVKIIDARGIESLKIIRL